VALIITEAGSCAVFIPRGLGLWIPDLPLCGNPE
jgi:hypothetical protein